MTCTVVHHGAEVRVLRWLLLAAEALQAGWCRQARGPVVMCVACRVHAKHIGHSLFGDDAYGGAAGSAVSALGRSKSLRYAFAHTLFDFPARTQ